jgi:predicted dehydrogenase
MARQIGYAVIGLGRVAQESVLPAFARAAENSRLVAVVSGDRSKAQALAREYRATAYHYDELRSCLQRDDVNAVYIAVPNSLHCDYAVEAARAGRHVLCETPMAVIADESRRMIRTSQTNRVKLMIAYRLHFRPALQKIIAMVRGGEIGAPTTFSSDFTLRVEDTDSPRLQRRMGGGTVYHLGVEAINAARALLGPEPAQVMAMTARASRRFAGDVDEGAVALIRFPDERLAHLHTSFREEPTSTFTVFGDDGLIRVHDAFAEDAAVRAEIVRHGETETLSFEPADAFAASLVYFSDCILADRTPEPSGVEGLQDVRIIEAIYRSSRDGRPVTLPRLARVEAAPGAISGGAPPLDRRHAS